MDANAITSTNNNGEIDINPNGTGLVSLNSATIRVGTGQGDTTISGNAEHNLIINTNNGTNSGSITIVDGADGDISITPNGNGSTHVKNLIKNTPAPTSLTGTGDTTITVAQILTEIITQSDNLGQGSTFTLDTAANMAGSLTTVGDSIEFYLINNDQTDAITVAAGTGGTITGGTNVGPSVTAKFRVRQTNVTGGNEAYDVFRLA